MKKLFFLALLLSQQAISWAQVSPFVNSDINFEIRFAVMRSNADGDDFFGGPDDISMVVDLHTSATGFAGQQCIYWSQDVPFYHDLYTQGYAVAGIPFNATYALHLYGFESDADNGEVCIYHSDYDDLFVDVWANLYNGGRVADNFNASFNNAEWDASLEASGNPWVFDPGNTGLYDLAPQKIWRYSAGDNIDNPLHYGVLNLGQTLSYQGASKPTPSGELFGWALGWTDTGGEPSPDVFQSFTLEKRAEVTISTDNDARSFDTRLDLYDAAGTNLSSDDDSGNLGDGRGSIITITLDPGTYRFRLEGYQSESGIFRAEISAKVVNDEVCNAILVPANGVLQDGYSNRGCSAAVGEEAIAPTPGSCETSWCVAEGAPHIAHSVWFKFVAPNSGAVEVSTCGSSSFDSQIAVYAVSDCNNFNSFILLKANDDGAGCTLYSSLLTINGLNAGQTYWVLVDGYNQDEGDLGIKITPQSASASTELATSDIMMATPNPTSGILNLRMTEAYPMDAYTLFDAMGKRLEMIQLNQATTTSSLDLSHLSKGVYLLQVRAGERLFSQKIVVQ